MTMSGSTRIGPDDPRYLAVADKRFNKRFSARPDYVRLVNSTEQVISAVEEAVTEGMRLVVTEPLIVEAGATVGETFRAL